MNERTRRGPARWILAGSMLGLAWAGTGSAQAAASAAPAPRTVELWPGGAPGARGDSVEDRPALTAYLPAAAVGRTDAGILVIPGGGFTRRCEDHEGVLVAEWLRKRGIAAFLLRYRVQPIGTVRDALADAHRGLRYLRAHASEWGVSPDRLGALGFSAGATLASSLALEPSPGDPAAADPVERVSSRPDFMVLAYGDAKQANPGLRGLSAQGLTPDEAARTFAPGAENLAQAPPAFLFCTSEDRGQVRGMADLYGRLVAAGRPAEAHFFGFGEHGTGFALGDPLLGEWPSLLVSWMRTSGLLTTSQRTALRGSVRLDGQPLPRGSVVLTPIGSPAAPVLIGYLFGTTEPPGEFALPAERGPVPGRYRVEVRQDAERWTSNAREPVMRKMQEKAREGGPLDAADLAEWTAWARGRDLSPSIEDQRVYKRRKPGDREDIVVEVKAGEANRIDLDIVTGRAR